ncbi:Holliday junction branch migration protein RuvA [Candidatus Dojkabacteria bacterium]|nr:Holliday junction branch migration protein RuvA [Candidatus Dojkabacteria bacterium]
MISYIRGKILSIREEDRYQIVEVLLNSGIGYQVIVPKLERHSVGSEGIFHTILIVREDSQTLYGFRSVEERAIFEMLISVSGIGPKIGVSILSVFSVNELYSILLSENHKALGKVSGLGQKGAQKIVIELKSKVEGLGILVGDVASSGRSEVLTDLENALKSLGFTGDALKEYVANAKVHLEKSEYGVEELLKLVLKSS